MQSKERSEIINLVQLVYVFTVAANLLSVRAVMSKYKAESA